MIEIREAKRKDSGAILNCIKGLAEHVNELDHVTITESEVEDMMLSADSFVKVFVAENAVEEICGFAVIFKIFSTFKAKTNYYLEDLFVNPEHRHLGVGSSLFNFIKDYADKKGAGKVEWYVNNSNQGAIDFYSKIGAKVLDYKSICYLETKQ
ncbi:GNAT family N-acetyltransferase [bacterium]|nr:GNAT family N-acetyltransferase [bacterium]